MDPEILTKFLKESEAALDFNTLLMGPHLFKVVKDFIENENAKEHLPLSPLGPMATVAGVPVIVRDFFAPDMLVFAKSDGRNLEIVKVVVIKFESEQPTEL